MAPHFITKHSTSYKLKTIEQKKLSTRDTKSLLNNLVNKMLIFKKKQFKLNYLQLKVSKASLINQDVLTL